jgi:hypothetical protein
MPQLLDPKHIIGIYHTPAMPHTSIYWKPERKILWFVVQEEGWYIRSALGRQSDARLDGFPAWCFLVNDKVWVKHEVKIKLTNGQTYERYFSNEGDARQLVKKLEQVKQSSNLFSFFDLKP